MKYRVVSGSTKNTLISVKIERVIILFILKYLNYSSSTFIFPRLDLGFCSEKCFLSYYVWYFI